MPYTANNYKILAYKLRKKKTIIKSEFNGQNDFMIFYKFSCIITRHVNAS